MLMVVSLSIPGQGSTGLVIRDHTGTCRGAQARWHEHCADALMMEAYACKEGLEFAGQCGVQRVHLETDCLELVEHNLYLCTHFLIGHKLNRN